MYEEGTVGFETTISFGIPEPSPTLGGSTFTPSSTVNNTGGFGALNSRIKTNSDSDPDSEGFTTDDGEGMLRMGAVYTPARPVRA